MHTTSEDWSHDHAFGQDRVRPGERRTIAVVSITALMMVVEVFAGLAFGSMALLADGLHMASHAIALAITVAAYVYARRRAFDKRFSFGTGKVNALGGFTGALLLAGFAIGMAFESCRRIFEPVAIDFDRAMLVAALGLVVNAASALILGHGPDGGSGAHPDHDGHPHHDRRAHGGSGADHNLRSAYLHVMADALTSLLAIIALLAGKYMDARWLDPVMGIVGALLVARWSLRLLRETSAVLLDHQAPPHLREHVRRALEESEEEQVHVADLHVWSIGPGLHAAAIVVVAAEPRSPDHYRARIPASAGIAHATVEVHERPGTEPD